MKKILLCATAGVLLCAGLTGTAYAADATEQSLATCYKQAQNSPEKLTRCLNQEHDFIKKEYKDVTERVFLLAKAFDKKKNSRGTTDLHLKSNQAFESYVERECSVMERLNEGDRTDQKNEELSCEINLYRMRIDMLENRFLSAAK